MVAVGGVGTLADNRMQRVLARSSAPPPSRTDDPSRSLQSGTPTAVQSSPTSIISESIASQDPATTPFPSAGIRTIDGVVSEVMKDSVIIHCNLAGENVDLRLPSALVPDELKYFGAPVRISLETTGGIRTPVIDARPIEPQPRMNGQDEVEDWLKRV